MGLLLGFVVMALAISIQTPSWDNGFVKGGVAASPPARGSTPALRPKLGGYGYIVNTLGNLGLVVRALAAKR